MAVESTLALNDLMTGPLERITSALDTVIASMERVGGVSGTAMASAKADIASANAELTAMSTRTAGVGNALGATTKKSMGFIGSMKSMVGMVGGLYAVQKGFSLISESIDSAMNRTQQETKLMTIMQERMGTKNLKGVTKTMTAQSKTGVIGATTQMAGAQQMGTFLTQEKSLKTLIPAMNNLAVQQKGVNATGEDMRNIGNMVGKVMQGQTGALRRVGISFSSAEEHAIKYGSETQRAAALAKVITNNVGNMNKAMAKTPQGQIQQMKNNLAGVKLEIGQAIVPAVTNLLKMLSKNMPAIKTMATAFSVVVSGVTQALTSIVSVASQVIGVFANMFGKTVNFKNMSKVIAGVTKVLIIALAVWETYKLAMTVASTAQMLLNTTMLGCPIMWIIAGIVAVIAVIVLVKKHWSDIRAFFAPFVSHIKKAVSVMKAAGGVIKGAFTSTGTHIMNGVGKVKDVFTGLISFVSGNFTRGWHTAWRGVINVFSSIWNGIKAVAKAPINAVIGMINTMLSGINKIGITIPNSKLIPKKFRGARIGWDLPKIPTLATGTKSSPGGDAWVGERGPELVRLPKGSSVIPNRESRQGRTIIIKKMADKVVVREEADIDKIAERFVRKLEQIDGNYA